MTMASVGLVGTYPPTRCGIASFTESLDRALSELPATETRVVRLVDDPAVPVAAIGNGASIRLPHVLVNGDDDSMRAAARMIDATCNAVIVQHEFGIYGGPDGADLLNLLSQIRVPVILVLHTVLADPSDLQRSIIEQASRMASTVVVMSEGAERTLLGAYAVAEHTVSRIPHGVFPVPRRDAKRSSRLRMLTWGLLGPGKGIEWAVMALALAGERGVNAQYRVIGQTHPKVLEREGEQYRRMLLRLGRTLGVADRLAFVNRYLDRTELAEEIAEADLVVLPYDSRAQATSGVLAEALAARVPVVATRFPFAVEMIPRGRGWIVPQSDPVRLADAIEHAAHETAGGAAQPWPGAHRGPSADWRNVAAMYRRLVGRVTASQTA